MEPVACFTIVIEDAYFDWGELKEEDPNLDGSKKRVN